MLLYSSNQRGGSGIGCLVMGILGAVAFFLILRGLFTLLAWAAPVLLVLAMVIRWQVFPATFRNWTNTLKTNSLSAILQLAFAILAFPFFALYMFLLALGGRKIEELQGRFRRPEQQTAPEEEFVDFEELESRPKGTARRDEPLEPPIIIREEPTQPRQGEGKQLDNPYDQLFK